MKFPWKSRKKVNVDGLGFFSFKMKQNFLQKLGKQAS